LQLDLGIGSLASVVTIAYTTIDSSYSHAYIR
jgi:hypothetical protein